jgi:hypothetical protein
MEKSEGSRCFRRTDGNIISMSEGSDVTMVEKREEKRREEKRREEKRREKRRDEKIEDMRSYIR